MGTFSIPPVDQAHTEEVAVGALLQIGDVLVVDAENAFTQRLVRESEHGQQRIGEGEFPVYAVLTQFAYPRFDVVGGRPGQIVVLHQHRAEDIGQERLPLVTDLVGAVLVPNPRRTVFEVVGKALVEDVGRQRDVGVGGEHLGACGKADVSVGLAVPVLRRAEAAGWVEHIGLGHFSSAPISFRSVRYLQISSLDTCGIESRDFSTAASKCAPGAGETVAIHHVTGNS